MEEDFRAGKGLAGLDEHQVRRWDSWHSWVTLAMLAAVFLTVTVATEHASWPPPDGQILRRSNTRLSSRPGLSPAGLMR